MTNTEARHTNVNLLEQIGSNIKAKNIVVGTAADHKVMQAHQLLSEDDLSVEAVFDALQDRLPPRHIRETCYSELKFSDLEGLKMRLDQGDLIVVSYTNFWLKGLERLNDFFVTWTFGSLGAFLALSFVGGMLGLLRSGNAFEAIVLFSLSIVVGLGLAIRYSLILPPMAEQSITAINGKTRELIYACRVRNEPVGQLIRVPLSDLAVAIFWGAVADQSPSFLSVFLCSKSSTDNEVVSWPSLWLATLDHDYPAAVPEELVRKAEDFAEVLGATYVGLKSSPL